MTRGVQLLHRSTHNGPEALRKIVPASEADDDQDEPLPFEPDLAAARDLSNPSRGQWLRERQDEDAEAGDPEGPEGGA